MANSSSIAKSCSRVPGFSSGLTVSIAVSATVMAFRISAISPASLTSRRVSTMSLVGIHSISGSSARSHFKLADRDRVRLKPETLMLRPGFQDGFERFPIAAAACGRFDNLEADALGLSTERIAGIGDEQCFFLGDHDLGRRPGKARDVADIAAVGQQQRIKRRIMCGKRVAQGTEAAGSVGLHKLWVFLNK